MIDDEKRPPEMTPETEGAAPASANAIGTATPKNTLFTSNYTTDSSGGWRQVSLVSNIEGEGKSPRGLRDGFVDRLVDGLAVRVASESEVAEHDCFIMPAPDVAWPRIVDALLDFCVRGQGRRRATCSEFLDLFDLCTNRKSFAQDVMAYDPEARQVYPTRVMVSEGYVPRYNREHSEEGTGLSRAPADAVAYSMAAYDAAAYEADGFRQVVVKGSDDIAEFSPSCNDDDTAPYNVKTHRELERQFHHRWGRHFGQRQFKRYLGHLRVLLPEVDFTEELDAMECPIGNGMLRRDFTGDEVTLHVRPYTVDDYRLGKYAGLRFDTDADGVVIPPEEPVYRRDGFPDWRPGEWLRDVMADEDGRRVLRAVLVLFLFPAVNIEKAVVFYSPGRSGKGTYLAMMRAMVGPKQFQQRYLASVGLEKMGQEYYLARLVGKVANLVDETEVTYLKKMADAKKVLGGDVVTGRDPYGRAREFIAKMLHVFCINSDLSIAEQTDAIFGRFLFVVFRECFLDRPGGIDRRIKEDFMQRPQTLKWFAYDAIANTPYFETSAYLDDNSYVIASNEENWAESNPTIRAWRLLREEILSAEDGAAKWADVRAMPVHVAHELMAEAKRRYEGDAGQLPREGGRTFRSTLERAAKADGFVLVRNKDGTPKQFPMAEWWVEDDMKPLMDALGDEGLRGWVRAHAKARPRAWLVRRDAWERYLNGRTSLQSQVIGAVEDKAALQVIEDAGMDAGAAREALDSFERDLGHVDIRIEPDDEEAFSNDELGPSEWFPSERFDRALRERYGRLKGEAVVASRAPGGYELWLNPWAAAFDDRNPTGNPHFSFPVPSGVSPRDELEHVTFAPVVERHVERDASWEEVAGVIEGAVREACEGEVRVCVTAPTGVAALPSFGEWIKLSTSYTSWLVRPVSPPDEGSS